MREDSRRQQRVHRTIDHTGYVARPFDDVAEIVERHAPRMLSHATAAAARRSNALMDHAEVDVGSFDPRAPLTVALTDSPGRQANHVWVKFGWSADRDKRLLANVAARLDFHPLTRSGRSGTTEVRLRGEFDPPQRSRHSPEAVLFGRRVVRAALAVFLEEVTAFLEDYEETLEMRISPGARSADDA